MSKVKCNWPNCLTNEQSKELCEQIVDASLGITRTDKAPVCPADCDEK